MRAPRWPADLVDARWPDQLEQGLEALSLPLPGSAREQLLAYLALLRKWNQAFNLTAVRDPGVMVSRQLLDSLSIMPLVAGPRVLDVGSGGGLPGVPLAIARPEWEWTLLDANGKKTRFLDQVRMALGLDNLRVVQARVERFCPPGPFDTLTSRAFAALPKLVAATDRLVAPGGAWVAMKGQVPRAELAQLPPELTARVVPLRVPGEQGARHAILIRRAAAPDTDPAAGCW